MIMAGSVKRTKCIFGLNFNQSGTPLSETNTMIIPKTLAINNIHAIKSKRIIKNGAAATNNNVNPHKVIRILIGRKTFFNILKTFAFLAVFLNSP
jgi:hypothetical protein